jgi:hypothetical protein
VPAIRSTTTTRVREERASTHPAATAILSIAICALLAAVPN